MNIAIISAISVLSGCALLTNHFYLSPKTKPPTHMDAVMIDINKDTNKYYKYRFKDADFNGKITAQEMLDSYEFRQSKNFMPTFYFVEKLNQYDRGFVNGLKLSEAQFALNHYPRKQRLNMLIELDNPKRVEVIKAAYQTHGKS